MKRQMRRFVGALLCALATAETAGYAWLSFRPEVTLSTAGRLAVLATVCLFSYAGGRCLSPYLRERGRTLFIRTTLWVWFALYLTLLAGLTVLYRGPLRLPHWDGALLAYYLRYNFNLIPGHMVVDMILSAFNGSISLRMCLVNIFGNFAALMPTAFFLPLLFPQRFGGKRGMKPFALAVTGMVAVIECTQFLTLTGTFDIDDFILNVSGACVMHVLLRRFFPATD